MSKETDYNEIIDSLHILADWIEKENHLQCHSVPRKAAYLITVLQDDNNIMRVQLMKGHYTIKERVLMAVGSVMVMWYKFKKKRRKK
ncbi:hypothetical protein EB001_24550 [bacterium]|jgi:hypothetical protein|nr:hypothetical protein [bacterium]